jgi:RimJ/RimL family protein N-acetyltransferase
VEDSRNELGQAVGFLVTGWEPRPRPRRERIEGRYCRLEPLEPGRHAADLFAANSADAEGRSWIYLPYGPFPTLADYLRWMNSSCRGDDPMFFTIVDRTDGLPAGVASYLNIAPNNGTIEVGHLHYALRLQRRPAATEAMFLLMERAFDLGYRRYEWKCDTLNAASRAAAQRLGLSYEGVFRQAAVVKGRNRDTAWYAAIDTEWPHLRAAFQTWLDPSNFDSDGKQRTRLSDLTWPILNSLGSTAYAVNANSDGGKRRE